MTNISEITALITALRAEQETDAISPESLGSLLQRILNLIAGNVTDEQFNELQSQVNEIIETDGKAECDTETDFDNNSSLEKVTLKFSALVSLPSHLHLAFIIYTVSGNNYIIGCKEASYPIVKVKSTTGTPDGQRNIINYEISFTARKALVQCAV